MYKNKPARLILENGTVFHGGSFGAEKAISGKINFSAGMADYIGIASDFACLWQTPTLTHPFIGNYEISGDTATNNIPNFSRIGKNTGKRSYCFRFFF